MEDTDQAREDGPLARDVVPPIPAQPRPGVRTIVATTAEYSRWRLSRVGLDLDDAIDEEVDDYLLGLKHLDDAISGSEEGDYDDRMLGLNHDGREVDLGSSDAIAYAENQPDVALWEGERCLAVIRPRPGGEPEVTRFDGGGRERPLPEPSTEAERFVWGLVKEHGPEACRAAIVEKLYPDLGPRRPGPVVLSEAEESVLSFVRNLGEAEALNRLHLAGPYGPIASAIGRLGTDAVGELRRIIEAGKLAS